MKSILQKLNVRFALFVVFAAACVYAPLSIVLKYESTLRHGTLYKFRTQPVDPYDAFRGRYVTLAFEDDFLESPEDEQEKKTRGALAYVRLAVGGDGFAKPVKISWEQLAGDDVITVDHAYQGRDWQTQRHGWRLSYPFNRYYLPEDIAPEAEKLYAEANRRGGDENARNEQKMPAYVTVRVRNGVGVIEGLYIDGKPAREAVREESQKLKKE